MKKIFQTLLTNNDSIKKLSIEQRLDLQDYVNMRKRSLPCMMKWESIRSNLITNNGQTIWQLSERFLNSNERPIGVLEPPAQLIEWIIEKSDLIFNK